MLNSISVSLMKIWFSLSILLLFNCARGNSICSKDMDCKGDRICAKGSCVTPPNKVIDNLTPLIKKQKKVIKKKIKKPPVCSWGFLNDKGFTKGETFNHHHKYKGKFPKKPWKLLKKLNFKTRITAPVVVDNSGNMYFGDHKGRFWKVSAKGKRLWNFSTKDKIWSQAALTKDEKHVYFGSDDDHLYKLKTKTGKLVWKSKPYECKPSKGADPEKVRCDIDSAPVITKNGDILIGGKGVTRLSSKGEILWTHKVGSHVRSSVAVDPEGNIYFGTLGGAIFSLTKNGKKRWFKMIRYQCDSTPVLLDGCTVVIGCDNDALYGLKSKSGKIKWRLLGGSDFRGGGSVGPLGDIYWGNLDKYLYKLDKKGIVKWRYRTNGRVLASPVTDNDGNILIVSEEKQFYYLSIDGNLIWSKKIPAISDTTPVVTKEGKVIMATEKGHLLIFGAK
jgi:outer membrane protein assembly factor BamB